jgi:FMN phosphatase YigB (HAD superfamily)
VPLVALDLDGTLVDQQAAARVWANRFARRIGLASDETELVATALEARRPKRQVFAEIVDRLHLAIDPDEVWADYRREMPRLVAVTDGDRTALLRLRAAGWTLGIITNGMVDNQEGKIRRTGLDALVDGWVISEATGHRKPSPEAFAALSKQLDCPLEGWMVGDSLELDIAGGAGVGLHTAWIDDGSDPADYRPDLIVDSVAAAAAHILNHVP